MTIPANPTCTRCNQPFPYRNYAAKRCLSCEGVVMAERAAQFSGKTPAVVTQIASEPVAIPAAVAVSDETEYRSDTERKYADHLETRRRIGEIVKWRYEPIRFRLADRTTYTADFMVTLPTGAIEFHETKFTWKDRRNDASRVKVKMAAELYPEFRFVGILPSDGNWEREEF